MHVKVRAQDAAPHVSAVQQTHSELRTSSTLLYPHFQSTKPSPRHRIVRVPEQRGIGEASRAPSRCIWDRNFAATPIPTRFPHPLLRAGTSLFQHPPPHRLRGGCMRSQACSEVGSVRGSEARMRIAVDVIGCVVVTGRYIKSRLLFPTASEKATIISVL